MKSTKKNELVRNRLGIEAVWSACQRFCIAALLFALSVPAGAEEVLLHIDTREGVTVPVYRIQVDHPAATVVLLSGGPGGFGKVVDGKPSSANFLIRSRALFAKAGFNVVAMGKASDNADLTNTRNRLAPEHLQDIRAVVNYLKKEGDIPVWLVGTSLGTISATAAAISFGNDHLAGLVLTSSIVSRSKEGAVPTLDLASIRIPVLVLHNANDACKFCSPDEVPQIVRGLKSAPVVKQIMVSGGTGATGNPCDALHYHGYIGMEGAVVEQIAAWIKSPSP